MSTRLFMKHNLTKHFIMVVLLVTILGVIMGCGTLHTVDYWAKIENIKRELDKGVDINAKNKFGTTALMQASRSGRTETTKLLIERGANINHKDYTGQAAIMYAASNGKIETVKLLIDKGADINIPTGKSILIAESGPTGKGFFFPKSGWSSFF